VPAAVAAVPARRRRGSAAEASAAAAAESAGAGSGAAGAAGGGPLAGMRFLVTGMDTPGERRRLEAALWRCGGAVLDAIPPADVRPRRPLPRLGPTCDACGAFARLSLRLPPGRLRDGRAAT